MLGLGRLLGILAIAGSMSPASAASQQDELTRVLTTTHPDKIAGMRASCAIGSAAKNHQMLVKAGFEAAPVGAWCVTVLTRAGRDKTLGFVRDPNSNASTPALAFDNGFVGAYLKHEPLPGGAPTMAALLPIAERCVRQLEPNNQLCTAAGHMLGLRAARGEVVILP